MNQYLVKWSIYPAYGDPEGDMLVPAETPEQAVAAVEHKVRYITAQGVFKGKAEDVTALWPLVLSVLKQKPEQRRLMTRILQALD